MAHICKYRKNKEFGKLYSEHGHESVSDGRQRTDRQATERALAQQQSGFGLRLPGTGQAPLGRVCLHQAVPGMQTPMGSGVRLSEGSRGEQEGSESRRGGGGGGKEKEEKDWTKGTRHSSGLGLQLLPELSGAGPQRGLCPLGTAQGQGAAGYTYAACLGKASGKKISLPFLPNLLILALSHCRRRCQELLLLPRPNGVKTSM